MIAGQIFKRIKKITAQHFAVPFKALTKPTLCQTLKKPARQGSKNANKGAYPDVSDRNLHVLLTQQAKNPSDFPLSEGFFAFAGFVSSLNRPAGRAVH